MYDISIQKLPSVAWNDVLDAVLQFLTAPARYSVTDVFGNAVLVPEGYRIKPILEEAKRATARFGSQAHTSAVGDSQGAQLSDSSCQLRRSRQAIGLCAVRPQLRSRSQVS